MKNQHKNGKDDRSLDHELDQLDLLYHRAESIEPPDLIDQAVLNKARRAVEPKNSWLDFGWIHGVTTVALVVLTVSVFTTQRETGEFEPTVGKSLDRAPAQATGQLSAKADQELSDKVVSDKVVSDIVVSDQDLSVRDLSGQNLSGRADEADASSANRAASPAVDTAGSPVSSLPVEAPKKEAQETRARDQGTIQSQMRAPANVAPAPPPSQSAKRQSLPAIVSESAEEGASRLNEAEAAASPTAEMAPDRAAETKATVAKDVDSFREKKQDAAKDQLKSVDKQASALELEDSRFTSQQQLLDKILALKHAGDDRWVKELSDFKKLYPDFPLPQELQN